MLEKKEKVLMKKVAAEVEKAKEFTRAKNKRGMPLLSVVYAFIYVIGGIVGIIFPDITFHEIAVASNPNHKLAKSSMPATIFQKPCVICVRCILCMNL